jgi:CBS domain-containing protein
MTMPDAAYADGQVAADLMLRDPKTLPAGATVADVRAVLANAHVQMALLTEDRAFRGAITALPDDAPAEAAALGFADPSPPTIAPDESAAEAFTRANASPHRRVLVLDQDENLLGLLCLNASRTRFCKTSMESKSAG